MINYNHSLYRDNRGLTDNIDKWINIMTDKKMLKNFSFISASSLVLIDIKSLVLDDLTKAANNDEFETDGLKFKNTKKLEKHLMSEVVFSLEKVIDDIKDKYKIKGD